VPAGRAVAVADSGVSAVGAGLQEVRIRIAIMIEISIGRRGFIAMIIDEM
jgi:hypothetical protein